MTTDHPIFFDNHATTQLDPSILDYLIAEVYPYAFNVSSIQNAHGDRAMSLFEKSTDHISQYFNVSPKQIIYTSGATEAANLVIQSVIKESQKPPLIITSVVEHAAILDTLETFQQNNLCIVEYIPVDAKGRLLIDQCINQLENAKLLCCMAANNEIGNIYPVEDIAKLCKKSDTLFLCDASQAIGKLSPTIFKEVDYLILSGHKIHALQGVGAVINMRIDGVLRPYTFGGGQQAKIRPGTINLAGAISLGKAIELIEKDSYTINDKLEVQRDSLLKILKEGVPEFTVTGDEQNKLCNNLHFCLPGLMNTMIVEKLRGKVSLSTGSACSSGTVQTSKVLQAMKLPYEYQESAIRIGLSKFTSDEEIKLGATHIIEAANFCREF